MYRQTSGGPSGKGGLRHEGHTSVMCRQASGGLCGKGGQCEPNCFAHGGAALDGGALDWIGSKVGGAAFHGTLDTALDGTALDWNGGWDWNGAWVGAWDWNGALVDGGLDWNGGMDWNGALVDGGVDWYGADRGGIG